MANYIPVRCKNEGVFQYAVSFTPQVDSRNMTFKLLYEHLDVIGETKAFDGAILFLSKKLPNVSVLICEIREQIHSQHSLLFYIIIYLCRLINCSSQKKLLSYKS